MPSRLSASIIFLAASAPARCAAGSRPVPKAVSSSSSCCRLTPSLKPAPHRARPVRRSPGVAGLVVASAGVGLVVVRAGEHRRLVAACARVVVLLRRVVGQFVGAELGWCLFLGALVISLAIAPVLEIALDLVGALGALAGA